MNAFKRNVLLLTVIGAAMMELIDTSIVNVALSHMSGNLGATLEDTSWVITSYAIANVIIIPITSFLALKLGRRNYYIGSVILFTLCSFLCGQATNIWMLVAFRFVQGMGEGALLSVSQAIVFELFPKEKRNVASARNVVGSLSCRQLFTPFPELVHQLFQLDGLSDVIVHTRIQAFFFIAFHGIGGKGDDHGACAGRFAYEAGSFKSVHFGHLKVHEYDIIRLFQHEVHGFPAIGHYFWRIAQLSKDMEDHLLIDNIVFGYQYPQRMLLGEVGGQL